MKSKNSKELSKGGVLYSKIKAKNFLKQIYWEKNLFIKNIG